ncbi:hypothetical protein Sjap_015165 [Stephania japonica]|uniref:Undecaprenyldiphospho-muramoylpentapeptide beta-N-acetylglucosaminyltransferase n=1 Tax=Stephania japonica TaxID=461633 RepID=A0AAP0IIQ5_9MAGN
MASPLTLLSFNAHFSKPPQIPFASSFPRQGELNINVMLNNHRKLVSCLALDQTDQNKSSPNPAGAPDNLRIVFAAGGSGGHISPAVAIADELKTINPKIEVIFVGTKAGMESSTIPSSGHYFVSIAASPLSRPILSFKNLILPYHLVKSMIETWRVLTEFDPHIVVGTGGYVSAPVCFAAAIRGLRVVIQEQNSVPGIANWVISSFADLVFVAFPSSVKYFGKNKCVVVTGNPIRLSLRKNVSKAVARLQFFPRVRKNWDSEAKVVLFLGGSLGADAINIAVLNMYHQLLLEDKNVFIIWQTGVRTFDEMESLVKSHPHLYKAQSLAVECLFSQRTDSGMTLSETSGSMAAGASENQFLYTMDLAYAAADLVVSRAGAMTCSEILATGKPSILIPSPNVAEGHQLKNAYIMAEIAGSKVITEDELDSSTLRTAVEEVLDDASLMAEMCDKALKAARPDAAAEIARHIISLGQLLTGKKKGR